MNGESPGRNIHSRILGGIAMNTFKTITCLVLIGIAAYGIIYVADEVITYWVDYIVQHIVYGYIDAVM